MKKNKIAILLPIKDHSERIPDKNFKCINGVPLHDILVAKFKESDFINKIYINTDSQRIKDYYFNDNKVVIIDRQREVIGDFISMNKIIATSLPFITEDVVLQTHATNPLVRIETFESAIKKYFIIKTKKYDSLFSVNVYYKRFFKKDYTPINHDPKILLRTQDLEPLLVENSCIYIFSKESFRESGMRIGIKPFLFEMNEYEAIDIDWPEDMDIVKKLYL